MFESTIRTLLWQTSEHVGVQETVRILNKLMSDYNRELADITADTGVIIAQPKLAFMLILAMLVGLAIGSAIILTTGTYAPLVSDIATIN